LKDNRQAPDPIESNKYLYTDRWGDSLIRDRLELIWSIDKTLTNLVCQLEHSDKVTNTEAKAHRDLAQELSLPQGKES
jgi:hypothetical protein